MSTPQDIDYTAFSLPAAVVSRRDLARLVNEAEHIDDELTAAEVRARKTKQVAETPAFSGQFTDFLSDNKLDFAESKVRTDIIKELRVLKTKAPVVHTTFAVPADIESLQTLAAWFRKSVHPQVLLEIGLQPALVAGVYVRTPNHIHDMSLRSALAGKREVLVNDLEALRHGK
jgi:F0F1-type ATP synthase delta subunit